MLLSSSDARRVQWIWATLFDKSAEEWRHKVGVAGSADGSARSTTRLLCARNQVFKTRTDAAMPELSLAREAALGWMHREVRAGVCHPTKLWGVFRSDGQWYPFNVCCALQSLRALELQSERNDAWIAMLQRAIDVSLRSGLGLDLNPSNFGREPHGGMWFYLDDEYYDTLMVRNLAGAIAARIPEHPELGAARWAHWGRQLRNKLNLGTFKWADLCDEIAQYPVVERFEHARAALLDSLRSMVIPVAGRLTAERVCVLSDIHGNLPALNAVLDDAKRRGAQGYLFLGDAVGYGPFPSECVVRLKGLTDFVGVQGNHDYMMAAGDDSGMNSLARECAAWTRNALSEVDLTWLESLRDEIVEPLWMAVHGAPKDPRKFRAYVYEMTYEDNLKWMLERGISLCFHGHTHVQMVYIAQPMGMTRSGGEQTVKFVAGRTFLVNPGSVGQPRDHDPRAAYAMWDRGRNEIELLRVSYDIECTVKAATRAGLPSKLEQRLRSGE